jgi:hypothetical protein
MEISKDALLRVVKAARTSIRVAETMQGLLTGKHETYVDHIRCALIDALFEISGEKDTSDRCVLDSETMNLLDSDYTDETVMHLIIGMHERRKNQGLLKAESSENRTGSIGRHEAAYFVQPAPTFIDRQKMRKQAEAGCGYMAPEGE